jgi:hypothetical protein
MTAAQRVTGGGIAVDTFGNVPIAATDGVATLPVPYNSVGNIGQISVFPAAGTAASITLPAIAGRTWLVHSFTFQIMGRLVVSVAQQVNCLITSNGTTIWANYATLPAVTATTAINDRIIVSGVALVGQVGFSVVLSMQAPTANTSEIINVGAYLL